MKLLIIILMMFFNGKLNHLMTKLLIIIGGFVKKSKKQGIDFYFVIQPYRIPLVKKSEHVRKTLESFDQDTKKIIQQKIRLK